MILAFSTTIDKRPTFFPEKIFAGLLLNKLVDPQKHVLPDIVFLVNDNVNYLLLFNKTIDFLPKIHTIRTDAGNRWTPGRKIDFFINARRANMYRFAPTAKVVSVQRIEIKAAGNSSLEIYVNTRKLDDRKKRELALNDGFDCWEDFVFYFWPLAFNGKNQTFVGKLIHWTPKKY